MQKHLNCSACKSRKQLFRNYVSMKHNIDMSSVDPIWNLLNVRDDKIDVMDERHVFLYASKPETHEIPVAKSQLVVVVVELT